MSTVGVKKLNYIRLTERLFAKLSFILFVCLHLYHTVIMFTHFFQTVINHHILTYPQPYLDDVIYGWSLIYLIICFNNNKTAIYLFGRLKKKLNVFCNNFTLWRESDIPGESQTYQARVRQPNWESDVGFYSVYVFSCWFLIKPVSLPYFCLTKIQNSFCYFQNLHHANLYGGTTVRS